VHAQACSLSQTFGAGVALGSQQLRSAGPFAPTRLLGSSEVEAPRAEAAGAALAGGVVGAALVASSVLLLTDLWAGRAPCECCWPRAPPPLEGAPPAPHELLLAWSPAARMRLAYWVACS